MANGPPVINVHGRRDVDLRCFASLGFSVQFSYIVSVLRYKKYSNASRSVSQQHLLKGSTFFPYPLVIAFYPCQTLP